MIQRRKYPTRTRKSTPLILSSQKRMRIGSDQTHGQKVVIANELWRQLIYKKEPSGLCPRCKTRRFVEACHIFNKGAHPGMRFDLDNGIPLCRTCHRRIDTDHKAKELFAQFYLGEARYDRLDLMSQGRGKIDMNMTILFLRAQ